ncbi:MAG: hypothetical protein KF745_03125 [Phycisphaeraceae bacterium]|nr:hypothetical protein [Phycisphaeraceae bacterium]
MIQVSRRWWMAAGVAVCVGVMAVGCSLRRGIEPQVATPAEGWSPNTAIDVRNFHGSVTVIVDPLVTNLVPNVVAGAKPPPDSMMDSRGTETVNVVFEWLEQEGGRVLKVRSGTTWHDPAEVWADITLRVPSCSGAMIWNRGGPVELIGVTGAIQVDNGRFADSSGPIRVRTDKPVTSPVALTTEEGTVLLQIPTASMGMFELASGEGSVELASTTIRPNFVTSDGQTTRAQINGGTNAILLRSYKGTVCAMVIENPESYTNKWK